MSTLCVWYHSLPHSDTDVGPPTSRVVTSYVACSRRVVRRKLLLVTDVYSPTQARMVAIQTVVEDVDGVAYDFSIYNFPSTSDCTQGYLDAIFPVGSILAVREPTFKTPMQGDRPLVRVDSPTDIIFVMRDSRLLEGVSWRTGRSVPRSPEYPATVEAWQQRGNEYFKSSQWFPAAFAYSHGLALNPDAVVLLLNRAEAYLRLGYYSGAVYDAQRVLSAEAVPDVHRGKATFRLAKAQYSRGEYEAARGNFLRWKKDHPEDNTADSWIDRCGARITERETGQYDLVSLIRTAKQKIRLDVANYMGSLEVRQMTERGGGRGVVATADVEVGELLVRPSSFNASPETSMRSRWLRNHSCRFTPKTCHKARWSSRLTSYPSPAESGQGP